LSRLYRNEGRSAVMNRWNGKSDAAELLLDECAALAIETTFVRETGGVIELKGPKGEALQIRVDGSSYSMIEQVLRALAFDFETLPLIAAGESKEVRLLTPKITLARLLPSLYSFTENRYGTAPGTERVRALFSAQLFRTMAQRPGSRHLSTAFLGLIEHRGDLLLAEHTVRPGNIEVRIKRYHIGSPLHRYRYTERYRTAHDGPPLTRWSRFARPVVCFDWRHPLTDEHGKRLADEPLSDDYAAVWLDDAIRAKQLASDTFEWMEQVFESKGLKLIDVCFFIDQSGAVIFGEISPDCMRVRSQANDDSDALDKDEWRSGGEPSSVLERYWRLYRRVFGADENRIRAA
jgi:phosphoribosylaminoimidazole-succinocarboxamide synthase